VDRLDGKEKNFLTLKLGKALKHPVTDAFQQVVYPVVLNEQEIQHIMGTLTP